MRSLRRWRSFLPSGRPSLRRQFVLVFVPFSIVLSTAGGWIMQREAARSLEEELDEKLRWVAGAAAEVGFDGSFLETFLPGSEGTPVWNAQQERLRRLQRYVSSAWVFRRDRTALVTTAPADSIAVGTPLFFLELYPEELDRAWSGAEVTTPLFFRESDQRYYKYGLVRIGSSEAMLAVLMRADYLEPLGDLRRRILFGSLLGSLLAGVVATLLAGTIVRPLERLSRVALRIQRGRLSDPVAEEKGDELGRLSRAMERMRSGILQRDEQHRLMLAQVAHEIRNPLGGLELFASAAIDSEDPDERRRLLQRMRDEIAALSRIIQDFLSWARPLDPAPRLHDLREPVHQAVELVQAEMGGRGVRIEFPAPPDPVMANSDPDHVKRIVLNLVRNASQIATLVRIGISELPGEVRVEVVDNGPGIPPSRRERIFEPFVTDREKGAGLGLAIVRRLAEANRGRIELGEDPPEHPDTTGASFFVYFPSADIPPDPSHVPESASGRAVRGGHAPGGGEWLRS